jgi:hypothetical protein
MKRVFLIPLLLVSAGASADLPTDQEYLALHLATANICSSLMPTKSAELKRRAAIMVCDMTDGTDEIKRMYEEFRRDPSFDEKVRSFEVEIQKDSPAEILQVCESLPKYPNGGKFCTVTPAEDGSVGAERRTKK